MSSPQSLLLHLPTPFSPLPLPRLAAQSAPSSFARAARRFPRLAASVSPPPLAASPPPPGGFGDGGVGGGGDGGGGRGTPDPGDGWRWRRWLEALHPELLVVLLLFFESGAAAALADALGARGSDDAAILEVKSGKRTRLVPDSTGTSYVFAGDDGKREEKEGGGRGDLSALQRQLERSWRRCMDAAVQLLLPEGYPHSVSSDYMQYSLWRGVQGVASQVSGVLSTQVCVAASANMET
jgi:hypothetical protein